MRTNTFKSRLLVSAFAAFLPLLVSGASFAQQQVSLSAGPTTATLPDGSIVPMWGYSCGALPIGVTSTATCAALNPATATTGGWSPVVITVPTGADLQINLTNNLSFQPPTPLGGTAPPANNIPTSLVIVGQLGGGLGTTATSAPSPVHAPVPNTWFIAGDTNGSTFNPPAQGDRVQSFATEVSVGSAAAKLCWGAGCPVPTPALRPGTYLIESGTHPSIQGPMGLYGILVVTAAPTPATATTAAAPGTAYPNVNYAAEVPLMLSEIDASQNNAVDLAVRTAGFNETSARVLRDSISSVAPTLDAAGNPIAGSGYKPNDAVTFAGTAACTVPPTNGGVATVSATGAILTVTFTGGTGCAAIPTATVSSATGSGALLTVALSLSSVGQCSGLANGTPVAACYPPAVNYTPLYYLINGVAFDRNNASASMFATAPATGVTGNVLVRLVNAGLRMHVPSIVGSTTSMTGPMFPGFSLVAEDGNPLPGLTRVQSEVFMAAGKTYDVMVDAPAACTPVLPATTCTSQALPIYDRELSLSGNSISRDSGMLAYISANGGTVPSVAAATAVANADTYYVIPTQVLTVSNPAKGVVGNDVNVYNVRVNTPPLNGTVTLGADGTFTYLPCTAAVPVAATCTGWTGDSFVYQANGRGPTATVTLSLCTESNLCLEKAGGIVMNPITYTSTMATFLQIAPPGILSVDSDGAGFPLTVDLTTPPVLSPSGTLSVDVNGGFKASVPGAGTYTFSYHAKNAQGTTSTSAATVTLIFPPASGPTVQVLDGVDKTTLISDYRWIIEEDRTFYADPACALNPSSCTTGGVSGNLAFGTNFHPSSMPMVATGCTGPLSCEGGQTSLGSPVVCDQGNGVCRPDPAQAGHTPVDPSQAVLDPKKRYYISVLPGDAANPFIGGNVSAPTNCATVPGVPQGHNADGTLNTNCGHGMGGASFKGQNASLMVLTQPSPYPTGKLSVFVFEDDFPLNGEHTAGGGVDVIAPQEPGLGGFNVVLFDAAGGTGDFTGQPTYDMFNQPLTNSLAGTIDPSTGFDACPLSVKVTDNVLKPGPDPLHPQVNATPAQCAVDPTLRGCQKGIVGQIVTCPKHESDGKTLSPLAGQAVVNNLYQGRYSVVATPGADRITRGEEWVQTNTLDGQKAHDAFVRVGEPAYFQEFGPAGYHVNIGFANPQIINDRRTNTSHTGLCDAAPIGGGQACNNTITGMVTAARMSRTPDERLYSSGSRDILAFTQCYLSLGDPDGADFAFTKCDAQGNFTFTGIPAGNWKITIFDQWNDQVVDGITVPVALANAPAGGTTLNMGELATHQWQVNIYTRTFLDLNGNGVSDRDASGNDKEAGLPLVATNIRFRDGSFSNFNNTDLNGYAGFNEVFPLFNWYVIETDSTRFKTTGVHVVYDSGGPTDGLNSLGTSYCQNNPALPGYAPCGPYDANSPYNNFANTYEKNPLPAALSVPGAVYCSEASCSKEKDPNFAKGIPLGSGANSTGRIDPPTWFGSYGWQEFSGQNSFLEFGKKPFAEGETGGIHGHVVYASTRPFDDPKLLLQLSWEPQVSNVTINLYKEGVAADGVTTTLTLIDTTKTSSFDDWAQGFRKDAHGNLVLDAQGNAIPNMNCPGQSTNDPFWSSMRNQPVYLDWYNATFNGGTPHTVPNSSQFKCYDGMHNWNQLQPAPYDGMYNFPSVTAIDPATGKPAGSNCTACVPNPDTTDPYRFGTPMLPAGKYVVEVVPPPGFELVKEEDKNILIGDNFIAPVAVQFPGLGGSIFIMPDQAEISSSCTATSAPQNATCSQGRASGLPSHEGDTGSVESFWPCVGATRVVPDYISLFPQSGEIAPFAGASRPLCDRKEVTLTEQSSALAKFYVYSSVHIAAHFTGQITDDFTAEFDPFSPQFGEKFAPSFLPVSIKDWAGNETSRTNADQFGVYNGLNYSTWEVDPPNPTGYGPTMMVVCMNDRGSGATPDPLFQPNYSQFCYELPFMPGQNGYFDTPVVPTSSFSEGYNHPDCNYASATPAVASVIGSDGVAGPWVAGPGSTLTINALGDQLVENPAWAGPQAAAPWNTQKITRHYGFGGTAGTVTIGGVPATVTGSGWSDSQITITVPSTGLPGGVAPCAVQQQAQYSGAGTAYCGQLVITAANGKQSIDAVTVTIGGKRPTVLTAGQTIQNAIDVANPGDMIVVPPGIYNEFLLMWKPIRLQGVGAASSMVNANAHPAGKMDPWRKQVTCLFGLTVDGRQNPSDMSCASTWTAASGGPNFPTLLVDRVHMEGILGWDASANGNLAQQLIERSLMGAYEGAAITVLGKGVNIPAGTDAWGSGANFGTAGGFPAGSTLLTAADCSSGPNGSNLYPGNYYCNPSSIDGMGLANSSQGGGGIFVHGWAHNIQVANNRIHNNTGTFSGGITLGQGEHIDLFVAPNASNPTEPRSCEDAATTNQGLPFCYNMNVNIHHNSVTLNSSLGDELFSSTPAGSGGVTITNGSDYYRFTNNWVCGNMSASDGGGVSHIGWSKNGLIEHNTIVFNQSTNPTIATNGGGLLIMGAPDADPPCSISTDKDCVPTPGSITPGDGTGLGLVINANLILGNGADSGSGGGLRFQHVNGSDVLNFPNGLKSCSTLGTCLWNSVNVTNNIIADNVAGWDGAGASFYDALAVNFVNNTVVSNDATAASGVLFQSLFAPLASSAGTNCTVNGGTGSCPQAAGLVSVTNSEILKANLPAAGLTCPPGHGTGDSCRYYSVPLLANNVIWQNRSFQIGVGPLGTGTTSQQNLVTLFNAGLNGSPASTVTSQAATGQCAAGSSYWDVGVRGDTGTTGAGHTVINGVTLKLSPTYSVLSSGDYTGSNNQTNNPQLTSQYCNGSRTPPEICAGVSAADCLGRIYAIPGTNEVNAWPSPVFSLTPSATVDEGNNWVNIRWGPLALINPIPTSPTYGQPLSDARLAVGSPAIDSGTASNAPSTDFFGNPRPAGAGFDIGAVEFPELALSPSQFNFGNQPVLTTSGAQVFTLANPPAGLTVTGITITLTGANAAEFTVAGTTCGSSLTAGAQCTISVTFTPRLLGPKTATLTVTDSEGTQTATLTGTGTGPLYSVTPGSLSFPNTVVNTVSAPQQLTVRNNQTTSMTVTADALGGLFGTQYAIATGTTCLVNAVVASGGTCVINVTFNPRTFLGVGGIRPATLSLTAAGLTTTVPLTGTAILFPVDVTPKGFFGINGALPIFPNTQIGQASVAGIATLSNYQSTPVTVLAITMPSQFQIVSGASTTCTSGYVLPPAAANGTPSTCTVAVEFGPNAQNLFFGFNFPWIQNATFTLSGSGGVNPTLTLMGTALRSAISGSTAFSSQLVNTTSASHVFTYTNSGGVAITLTGVTLGGTSAANYTIVSNTCSGAGTNPVAAGGTCQVGVTWSPTATGNRTATLTFTDSLGIQSVGLTGTGVVPTFSGATSFGNVLVGSSVAQTITLTNNASAGSATITAVPTVSGTDFTIVAGTGTTCVSGAVLAAGGGSCTFRLQFAPASVSSKSATLGVTDTAGTQTVGLSGAGVLRATTTPGSITFGNTARGSVSATTLVTLANPAGNPIMTGTSIAFGGTNATYFGRSTTTPGNCGTGGTFTVSAGSSCTIGVVFAPPSTGTTGAVSGTMTISTTSAVPPPTSAVALSGTAL